MVKDNKPFNTYKEELDLEILRRYCEEHGEERTFLGGERLRVLAEASEQVRAGELAWE